MSAPMNKLPQKDFVNSLVKSHLFVFITTISSVVFSTANESLFSIIKYKFELILVCITCANVFLWFFTDTSPIKPVGLFSKILDVAKTGFVLFCSSLFFHLIAILFGAPLVEMSTETFHFGMILSVTAVLPVLCTVGTSSSQWMRIFLHNSPELGAESIIYFVTVCSIIGAWLGAFPIPLDWDRPWQEWPITCVIGTLLGYCTGLLIGVCHLYLNYHRIKRMKIT